MRLRWGPYASQLAEQVVVRDPLYVVEALAEHPGGGLASVFRELILRFDARPLSIACARCGRSADGVCAYPASIELIGFCDRCRRVSATVNPRPTLCIASYEDAVRHVAASFRRGHRIHMRRIVGRLAAAKGGPHRLTEGAACRFFSPPTGPGVPRDTGRQPPACADGAGDPGRRPE